MHKTRVSRKDGMDYRKHTPAHGLVELTCTKPILLHWWDRLLFSRQGHESSCLIYNVILHLKGGILGLSHTEAVRGGLRSGILCHVFLVPAGRESSEVQVVCFPCKRMETWISKKIPIGALANFSSGNGV